MIKITTKERLERIERLAKLMEKFKLPSGDWNIIDGFIPLEAFIDQELIQEYKKGFNDCLKEQGLTGQEHQHLYL